MNFKDIDKQMKKFEEVADYKLPEQSFVVVRLDGKNFSRVTANLNKPFDEVFQVVMATVMTTLASEIDGCIHGFTQSDEITLILHSNKNSTPYFNNRIQKMSSIIAAKATLCFNKIFSDIILDYQEHAANLDDISDEDRQTIDTRISNLLSVVEESPVFDCRVYTVPEDEYVNVLYWRQQQCYSNAFNYYAEATLGKNACTGKNMSTLKAELKALNKDFDKTVDAKFRYGVETIKIMNDNNEFKWDIFVANKFKYDEFVED